MRLKRIAYGLAALAVAATAGAMPAAAQDKKTYVIYLSNNFVGNDWRQQMERVAKVSVSKGPLAGRVDLRVENVENTVQAQINSLNNIIRQKPDAILVDAASDSALNPTLKKACDQGIVVVSFDQTVTEPCAYAVASDWNRIPEVMAEWMAVQLNGKGNVIIDRGLAGAPISAQLQGGYEKVLKNYPDIKIVGQQASKNDRASGLAVTTDMLTANPDVTGIFGMNDPSALGAVLAVEQAGKAETIKVTGVDGSPEAVEELKREGSPFIGTATQNPAEMVRQAVKVAEAMAAGNPPTEKTILIESVLVDRQNVAQYPGW